MKMNIPETLFGYLVVGALGGIARLVLGVRDTWMIEIVSFVAISLPISIMCGYYAETKGMGFAAYPVAYFAGIGSLNIARTMMTEGISGIIAMFARRS